MTLAELARAIARQHRAVEWNARAALVHAKRAGQLLIAAKKQVPYGRWLTWLRRADINDRTAQAYLRLARQWARLDPQHVADLPLREALMLIADHAERRATFSHAGRLPRGTVEKIADRRNGFSRRKV